MGNFVDRILNRDVEEEPDSTEDTVPVEDFEFHDAFPEDETNGLTFHNIYIPEEILLHILTFVDAKEVLRLSLVCRNWCNIIKSDLFWRTKYEAETKEKPEKFPWYVYYCYLATDNFKNLLENPNGADEFKHWHKQDGDDGIIIECPPIGCDPLPNVPEFANDKHCFVTSFMKCTLMQQINVKNKRLLQFILKRYKFPVYLSDWTAGRFDCSSVYRLGGRLESISNYRDTDKDLVNHVFNITEEILDHPTNRVKWRKIELIFTRYPENLARIVFIRYGKDRQFWAGNYGSKFSGGTVKFILCDVESLSNRHEE